MLLFLHFGQSQILIPILFLFHFVLLDLLLVRIHYLGLNLFHYQVPIYIHDQFLGLLLVLVRILDQILFLLSESLFLYYLCHSPSLKCEE